MAKPAFIYAFDNLGPERFTELCGLLLGARHKGFLLGGIGPDGGVDGEVDTLFGEWRPESISPLRNVILQPGHLVIFQFKHKVTARNGQIHSRTQLLDLYKCRSQKNCELHSHLIQKKRPAAYVLVTNVEVNSEFREKFTQQCRSENQDIKHYQIFGLDELESWVTNEPELRHLYFPTIFGPPRFHLQILLGYAYATYRQPPYLDNTPALNVSVLNVGTVPSYVHRVEFEVIVDGQLQTKGLTDFGEGFTSHTSNAFGIAIQPGQKHMYLYHLRDLSELGKLGRKVFPVEVHVHDEIGNMYSEPISESMRNEIMKHFRS
jgi:hypothetical protein